MADYEDDIFSNLPRSRRRPGERDDDDRRLSPRQLLAMNFVPEGPLPQRPRPSGKGGPSLTGASNSPPVLSAAPTVTGTGAVGQTLTCSQGVWLYSPTSYTYQWLRDGVVIAGATTSTYVVVSGDLGHSISCTVTATNANGSASGTSNTVLIVALPVNTVAPAVSGATPVGSTLSCTTGTWTNSPTGYAYQWLRNGVNIPAATSSTYVTVTADGGTSIRCTVTASNATASASATSNALAVDPPLSAPANTVAPVVSGTATVGSTLSCTTGTWTNSPTSYAYQWLQNGLNISGATASTYLTVTADGGTSVSCRVMATNAAGNTSIASNALAIAAGAPTSVWSASDAAANGMTLSNGGLTFVATASVWQTVRGTVGNASGKLYIEFKSSVLEVSANLGFGLADATFSPTSYLGNGGNSFNVTFGNSTCMSGFVANYNISTTPVANDVWAIAVDLTAGKFWLAQNNVWQDGGNPATGASPMVTITAPALGLTLFPGISVLGPPGGTWTIYPTAASQTYAPPAGFTPWG